MTDLLIRHPLSYATERAYILDVMLGEFLGLTFSATSEERDDIVITVSAGQDFPALHIADVFFKTKRNDWLKECSLPVLPLSMWGVPPEIQEDLGDGSQMLPVLYGKKTNESYIGTYPDGRFELGLDIFGSAFFMLSRYEEACLADRDEHNRFPASASVAANAGFLERPIINEYLEVLWACLTRLFPTIERRKRNYRALISHDIDRMFTTRQATWRTVFRNSIGDLTRRTDPVLAARRIFSRFRTSQGDYRYEPTNTFDFIMDCSEQRGIASAFYWITQYGTHKLDADYSLGMPWVQNLIKHMSDRGHEVGLHGSYDSYNRTGQIKAELAKLIAISDKIGVNQASWGGRQHYLRWDAESSWQNWDDAGLSYDSTLGYPESAGFRCGTCYEFPAFNLVRRKRLEVRERPLVAMDSSLLSATYMALAPAHALDRIESLANNCRRFAGDFTLLWHNDNLVQGWQRKLYQQVMESVSP